jgi:ribosome maturation factor RimP
VALTGRLFLFLDASEPQHASLESRLAAIVGPTLEGMGYELVRVVVLGRDRPTVQVMADRADGSQITVADCEAISHALGAVLDVEDPIPGTWSLERN